MARCFAAASLFLCFATSAWAQAQPAPATQAATSASKSAVKKPAPKAKASTKLSGPVESGPCRIGVISAIGDQFVVQKIGLTVFGNEQAEVPIDAWGLDDLVVARVRAAAPGTAVRKIAYAKGAFDPWYHGHGKLFFNNPGDNLTAVVRPIAASAKCERYIVVTRFSGQLAGTNQTLDGIGVSTNWSSDLFKRGALFAYIHVTAFDGQTFAIHEDPFANIGARLAASLSKLTKDDNIRPLANFEAPSPPEAAANNAILRDGTRALLVEQLDKMMPAYLKQ
jgi:hypothetical protein